MRIYTKTGDRGETGLIGGKRVSKNSILIHAIGGLDELNAGIGILVSLSTQNGKFAPLLAQIQNDIFSMGAEIADTRPARKIYINNSHVTALERKIDALEEKLPPLRNFILPGGTLFAAHAHMARAICRRAERDLAALNKKMRVNPNTLAYLNRLSDLLFMLARADMHYKRKKEILWVGKK